MSVPFVGARDAKMMRGDVRIVDDDVVVVRAADRDRRRRETMARGDVVLQPRQHLDPDRGSRRETSPDHHFAHASFSDEALRERERVVVADALHREARDRALPCRDPA